MFVNNFFDDRQSETRALGFGGDIRFERALQYVIRETRPRINHCHTHTATLRIPLRAQDHFRCLIRGISQMQFAGVLRVLDQVVYHLV